MTTPKIGDICWQWGSQTGLYLPGTEAAQSETLSDLNAMLGTTERVDELPCHFQIKTTSSNLEEDPAIENLVVARVPHVPQDFIFSIRGFSKRLLSMPTPSIVTGTCLFDTNTAKAELENGEVICLTDPNVPVEDSSAPIKHLLLSDTPSLSELDTVVRLGTFVREIIKTEDSKANHTQVHIPCEEYILYLAEAYNKQLISAELMLSWATSVVNRHTNVVSAFKSILHYETPALEDRNRIFFHRPMLDAFDHITEQVKANKPIELDEIIKILINYGGIYWEHVLNQPTLRPTSFQNLNYLSYQEPGLLAGSPTFNRSENSSAALVYNLMEAPLHRKICESAESGNMGETNAVFIGIPDCLNVFGSLETPETSYRLQLNSQFEISSLFRLYERMYGYPTDFLSNAFQYN